MAAFGYYHDSGADAPNFARPINTGDPLLAEIDNAVGGTVDTKVWFGSDIATDKVRANSNPGVDQITTSITDSIGGNSNPTTRVKLATTQAGLAGATGGAAINMGTQILGASANAFRLWTRYTGPSGENGGNPITYTDLGFTTNQLRQEAI